MMGRRENEQGQFFYAFDLDKVVPPDHLVRQIDCLLDLSWVHKELAPYYSHTGWPSIDPELMKLGEERPFRLPISAGRFWCLVFDGALHGEGSGGSARARHRTAFLCCPSLTTTRDVDRHGISPEKSTEYLILCTLNIIAASLYGLSEQLIQISAGGAAKTKGTAESIVPEAINAGRLSQRKLAATSSIDSGEPHRALLTPPDGVKGPAALERAMSGVRNERRQALLNVICGPGGTA